MPLWSIQEWRARIGSSYCALGVWRPINLRCGRIRAARAPVGKSWCGPQSQSTPYSQYSSSSSVGFTDKVLSWFMFCLAWISSWIAPSLVMRLACKKMYFLIEPRSLKCVLIALSYFKLLLLCCGDIETNPGPDITQKELQEVFVSLAFKWFQVGIQLGIDTKQLFRFRQNFGPKYHILMKEVIATWLNGDTKVVISWENVVKILRTLSVNERELSDKLRVKYGLLEEGELQEALKSGYVTLRITKVLVSGSAGNGKTHTKYLLFNELAKLEDIRKSTPLFDDPVRALSHEIVGTSRKGWHKVTYDELNEMLAGSISDGSITHSHAIQTSSYDQTETQHSPAEEKKPTEKKDPEKQVEPVVIEDSKSQTPSVSRQKVLDLLEQGKKFKPLYLHWIHFIDSGGQPQFIELLPAFVKNTSVVMIVLKLPESLHAYPKIEYFDQKTGKLRGTNYVSHLRNDQIIQNCARTLSNEEHSQVMVVGTHRDGFESLDELTKTIDDKNRWLVENLKRALGPKLISFNPPNRILYPINAKTPNEDDQQVANQIRQDIESEKDRHPPYKIPIAWFLLEQDMRKLSEGVITLEECYKLALSLHMTEAKVKAALEYLHKLNIILYYPTILENVIFVSPQVIVDKITELVAFSFELRAKSESERVNEKWNRYITFGEVEFKMLKEEHFSRHYIPGVFSPAELIKIFTKLLIMAPVTDPNASIVSSVYFMPSLLPEIATEDLETYRPKDSPLVPAVLYFNDGCAPGGTFSRLSVYLITQCGWKRTDTLYRNYMKFHLPDEPAEVTIIDVFDRLEVYLTESPRAFGICFGILKKVKSGLEEAYKTLSQDTISYSNAVMCPNHGQGACRSVPHAAIVNDTAQYCICTENPKVYCELHRKCSVWFSQSISLRGVQFISQSLLTVSRSDELQTLSWEKHGLKIHVPPGVLSDCDTQCEFSIGASLSGSFKLPDNHTLVSPVYYIQPSKKLAKPVTLELEHCCSLKTEEDTKALVPIFAQSSTREPPYTFEPLSGGKFSVNSKWGTFDVTTFSLFGLSWSPQLFGGAAQVPSPRQPSALPKKPPVLYSGWIYFRPISHSFEWFSIKLIVIPRIEEHIEAVKREYSQRGWIEMLENQKISFLDESSVLSLDIGEAGITTDNGWLIKARCPPPEISEEDILESKPKDSDIASCELCAKWNCPRDSSSPSSVQDLDCEVKVKGIEKIESFLITISPQCIESFSSPKLSTETQEVEPSASTPAKTLGEDDWAEVCLYLDKLEISKARILGGLLGLSAFTLHNKQSVADIVLAWLRKEDKVSDKCGNSLTWEVLVKALRRMKQNGIADEIKSVERI